MLIFLWFVILIIALIVLVKSTDWFVESSEKIAFALKVSPFIIGITMVAIGTSLPELLTSLVATLKGNTEVPVANAIGSNIANIFLIIGLSAIAAKRLVVRRNLIDLDLPLLASSSVIFLFIILDRKINWFEGLILIFCFLIYLSYTLFERKEEKLELEGKIVEVLPSRIERRRREEEMIFPTLLYFFLGIIGLIFGARYTVESLIQLSLLLKITTSFLVITIVAIGTSLPELAVSVLAAAKKKYEISIGNVIGSNVFNALIVTGFPSLFRNLIVDDLTFKIGFPFFILATLLMIISGISRRIHIWEGMMFVLIYLIFIIKLFNLF